jgi:hypothetical protein
VILFIFKDGGDLVDDTKQYTLWIESEEWLEHSWDIYDTNTDVIVTFQKGDRWVASFYTYKNIYSLAAKNRETGENLSGKYCWGSDMFLIEECSRACIEEVISDLIHENNFESVFRKCENYDV